MLFEQRFWALIGDGTVTVTFRRWRRQQVLAGRSYRTPGGIVDVTSVTVVDPDDIEDADARRSGYESATALRADLRGDRELPVYRIEFVRHDQPDPREQLAADDALDDAARVGVDAKLDRLDRASSHGSWTRETLDAIAARPATPAGELAVDLGRERLAFKTDVRKLKNLGLTYSLPVGYELSPRGRAYLGGLDDHSPQGPSPTTKE